MTLTKILDNGITFIVTNSFFNSTYDGTISFTIVDGQKEHNFLSDHSTSEHEGITYSSLDTFTFNSVKIYSKWGGMEETPGESSDQAGIDEARKVLTHYLPMFGVSADGAGLLTLLKSIDPRIQYIPRGLPNF